VISIGLSCVADGKVILDNKSGSDVMGGVSPQAWCDGAWVIAMGFKEVLQLDIGQFASLGQPIHAMPDLNIDVALVDEQAELVVFNDLVGQDGHWDVHVCIVFGWHGGAEIFEIAHHGFGIRS